MKFCLTLFFITAAASYILSSFYLHDFQWNSFISSYLGNTHDVIDCFIIEKTTINNMPVSQQYEIYHLNKNNNHLVYSLVSILSFLSHLPALTYLEYTETILDFINGSMYSLIKHNDADYKKIYEFNPFKKELDFYISQYWKDKISLEYYISNHLFLILKK